MANLAAIKFVKQICAAFSRYPVPDETKQIYTHKLSFFRLTQVQWDRARDDLMESHKEEGLPQPAKIIEALKLQQSAAMAERSNLGWMYFDSAGTSFALRVKNDAGIWISVKTGKVPNMPRDAENIEVCPDNRAYQEDEAPTPDEVKKFVAQFTAKIQGMK